MERQTSPGKKTIIEAPWKTGRKERATALGAQRLTRLRGLDLMRDQYLNKGTAFTHRERDLLGLRGLLPPAVFTIEQQLALEKDGFDNCPENIDKYSFLETMHTRNETLYYRFLLENIVDCMPIVYTPTVGQACIEFSDLYRSRPRGLFMSRHDQDHFKEVCTNWPQHDVDMIVITDGSRILGLGDLGINGMGIPIGKLALYVAAAGFMPWRTLPITVDMGTNNDKFRKASHYIGLKEDRPDDEEFYSVMKKAIEAIKWRWPNALIQFEDFSNEHAFGLLHDYKNKILCFNDDIQGTACTVLAGLFSALRIQREEAIDYRFLKGDAGAELAECKTLQLRDQRIVFYGAGSAGVGVADLIAEGMALEEKAAGGSRTAGDFKKSNFWLVDTKGVVTSIRGDNLQSHKIPYARGGPNIGTLLDAVKQVKPTIMVGLAGQAGGSFTEEMIRTMNADCEKERLRPIIMALSNPTSKAECTAEQAYKGTGGRAIFAAGSPFAPVEFDDPVSKKKRSILTGQGNNMYIFPGVGYGAVMCKCKTITSDMFVEAAKTLSEEVTVDNLRSGAVYPNLSNIRDITAHVAASVCEVAVKEKQVDDTILKTLEEDGKTWMDMLGENMWWPHYQSYV